MIKHQRYAHSKQFKRANKALRTLRIYLGRTVRDIARQIGNDEKLRAIFLWPLYQASTVLEQRQRQRGCKIYSLHAPEVEMHCQCRGASTSSDRHTPGDILGEPGKKPVQETSRGRHEMVAVVEERVEAGQDHAATRRHLVDIDDCLAFAVSY